MGSLKERLFSEGFFTEKKKQEKKRKNINPDFIKTAELPALQEEKNRVNINLTPEEDMFIQTVSKNLNISFDKALEKVFHDAFKLAKAALQLTGKY